MYIVPNTQITFDDELQHHGILGMKWGIRRFQRYPDGHKGGKEIGEAAKQQPRKPNKALMAVGKAAMPVAKVGMAAGKAIKKRHEAKKQFEKEATDFYKEHGRASKAKNLNKSEKKRERLARGDYAYDKYYYGKKGVKRIMDKVENRNMTLKQAERSEVLRTYAKQMAAWVATAGALVAIGKAGEVISNRNDGTVKSAGYTMNSDLLLPLKKR